MRNPILKNRDGKKHKKDKFPRNFSHGHKLEITRMISYKNKILQFCELIYLYLKCNVSNFNDKFDSYYSSQS